MEVLPLDTNRSWAARLTPATVTTASAERERPLIDSQSSSSGVHCGESLRNSIGGPSWNRISIRHPSQLDSSSSQRNVGAAISGGNSALARG